MNSKQKGKRAELEVAHILKDYGWEGRRGVQYCGGTDSPDVIGLPGVHIEVKHVEHLNIQDAMEQSIRDAGNDIPVVFHRKNNTKYLVTMRVDEFMNVIGEWINGRREMDKDNNGHL